ncbi:unnamed protein product [Protopolystoma xenopodis]|uniref:Uncharacterized protein n=1 Tax=Protopolystoma xenopodis TaxID=117903 RepID=A0A3S5C3P3_9PLAT|nr:unnamed protein product [Protopolystoma xenopodis]
MNRSFSRDILRLGDWLGIHGPKEDFSNDGCPTARNATQTDCRPYVDAGNDSEPPSRRRRVTSVEVVPNGTIALDEAAPQEDAKARKGGETLCQNEVNVFEGDKDTKKERQVMEERDNERKVKKLGLEKSKSREEGEKEQGKGDREGKEYKMEQRPQLTQEAAIPHALDTSLHSPLLNDLCLTGSDDFLLDAETIKELMIANEDASETISSRQVETDGAYRNGHSDQIQLSSGLGGQALLTRELASHVLFLTAAWLRRFGVFQQLPSQIKRNLLTWTWSDLFLLGICQTVGSITQSCDSSVSGEFQQVML